MLHRVLFTIAVLTGLIGFGLPSHALADKRVALVVGNAAYVNQFLDPLPNPTNDAADVAAELKQLGFDVILATNGDKRAMEMALQQFAREASGADAALFYYAGHALQYQGQNYLLPVDADVQDEVSLAFQTVPLSTVRLALDRTDGVKVLVLDACRNNPLADRLQSASSRSRSIGGTRGLARIDKTQGMVIAFSASAGQVAADGKERNSPFTAAFLNRLREPGLEIGVMFKRIAADVFAATGGRQRPEFQTTLLNDYYLNQLDREAWEKIKDDLSIASLGDFIARYPASPLTPHAQEVLLNLQWAARERAAEEARQQAEADKKAEQDKQKVAGGPKDEVRKTEEAGPDPVCTREQEHIALLQGAGAQRDMVAYAADMKCKWLRALVLAALDTAAKAAPAEPSPALPERPSAEAPAAPQPSVPAAPPSPPPAATASLPAPQADLPPAGSAPKRDEPGRIRQAQQLLRDAGCYRMRPDGVLGDGTRKAIQDYAARRKLDLDDGKVEDALLADLKSRPRGRVCPLHCSAGRIAVGEVCVALKEPDEQPRRVVSAPPPPPPRPDAPHPIPFMFGP
jgi:hypothetical protein